MVALDIGLARALRPRSRMARKLVAHLFTLLFLVAWEAASFVAPSYLLPGPGQVALRLWSFVTSWRDLGHLGASLFHVGGVDCDLVRHRLAARVDPVLRAGAGASRSSAVSDRS